MLQEQQLETAELPFKLSWLLRNIPYCKSVHNTSMQNEYLSKWQYLNHQFNEFIDTHGMLKSLYVNTCSTAFSVQSRSSILEWMLIKCVWEIKQNFITAFFSYFLYFIAWFKSVDPDLVTFNLWRDSLWIFSKRTSSLVGRTWGFCHIPRGGSVTYTNASYSDSFDVGYYFIFWSRFVSIYGCSWSYLVYLWHLVKHNRPVKITAHSPWRYHNKCSYVAMWGVIHTS